MKYYTYILYSPKFDKFYYGQTQQLQKRIIKHNAGLVKSTKLYIPWKIYAFIELGSRSDAMSMETKLKNCKSRKKTNEFILNHQFIILESQKVFGPEN